MKRGSRGYTLIEVVVVIGIVGIIAAIAIPTTRRMRERSDFNQVIRQYQSKLAQARSLAVGAARNDAWPATARVRSAGIRMVSPTQYTVFIDQDVAPGGEINVSIVDLVEHKRDTQVSITAPAEIRMNNSGSLIAPAPIDVVFRDAQESFTPKTLRVSLSGTPRIL